MVCSCVMVASTMSSLMPSRSTLGAAALSSVMSTLAGVGEEGGVVSMATEFEEPLCDRLTRLLGCESGD